MILILSPTASASEYVRAEWQYALVADKIVTPVLRSGEHDLLPAELKGTHCEDVRPRRDLRDALDAVVRLARDPPPRLGSALSVPVPPPHYRPRPHQFARIAERLALDRPKQLTPQERAFVVHGMVGVGKSVLAAAVARSTATRRVFKDRVIWVSAGREANVLPILQQIGEKLKEDLRQYQNESDARAQLSKRLEGAAVLIVLDNVWSKALVEPIHEALGRDCRLLVTTREPGLVELGMPSVDLAPFSKEEAVAYLQERARADNIPMSPAIEEVAVECGLLPFALALAGAMARSHSWEKLAERLRAADLPTKKLLLGKAYQALPRGGALIVYDPLIDDARCVQAHGLLSSLNMLIETTGGSEYTGAECTTWMQEAGFRETRIEPLGDVHIRNVELQNPRRYFLAMTLRSMSNNQRLCSE